MTYKIIISDRLPGLNEYISAERTNRQMAAALKKKTEENLMWQFRAQIGKIKLQHPVMIRYRWVEPNCRRDKDNIAFAKKFIQDALVGAGYLKDDGWRYIKGFSDEFAINAKNPKVEIEIEEVEK